MISSTVIAGGLALLGAGRLFFSGEHNTQSQTSEDVPRASAPQPSDPATGRRLPVPAAVDAHPAQAAPATEGRSEPEKPGDQHPEPARVRVENHRTSDLIEMARTTSDRWLKTDVVEELAVRRAREGIPLMVGLLRDGDREVRLVSVNALAELGADDHVQAVRAALAVETDLAVHGALEEALHELDRP